MFGLIAWLAAGGVAGWLACVVMGRDDPPGLVGSIVTGVLGALLGGVLWGWIVIGAFDFAFNLASFMVALAGAIVLLVVYYLFFGNR
jgi:uncharacterized membrane protein YeaQ/YmgE (transglycosylase-associated protein family)